MIENNFSSFGALLKIFRKRRHFTQQQLAAAIGVHRSTLINWEQGAFLPGSKAMVLELVRHLKLDDQQTRQLLEASLTALAPHWSVPLPRNPYFTGRKEILEILHAQLGVDQAVALTQSSALHGLGGVGKTQIALEYAYRHALEYRAVFWIGAETEEQIVSGLLRIASVLQLPEREDKDVPRVVAAVQSWLATRSQWLLIWDNVEDLTVIDRFLPVSGNGALLLTTRRQVLGTLAWGMDLAPMEQEEGMLFLLRRAKVLAPDAAGEHLRLLAERTPAQYRAAAALVETLGGLPLALDQAGAYLETARCGLSAYLELFCTRRAALLTLRGEGARDHPASVFTTFTLALTAMVERHPCVLDLLRVCALLQADAIPEELFRQSAEHLGAQLQAVCGDALEWNRIIAVACSHSLLSRQPEEQTLSMHRLVQAVLVDGMSHEEWEQWCERVTAALDVAFPDVLSMTAYAAWKQCERLLPHALLRLQHAEMTPPSLPLASLAHKTACYLLRRGRYAQAELLFRTAVRIREHLLGPEHPEVAISLNSLAILALNQGKYAQAEPLFERASHIREHALGSQHPDVAASLNNLATLFLNQGKYAQAEPLLQRALSVWEQSQGPEHPNVTIALNNLAELSWKLGKYSQAERYARRALSIWGQALGPEHPGRAEPLVLLANLFREQGKYTEAEALYRQAWQIWEQALGPENPNVATSLIHLAKCYCMQGRDAEAEQLYQRAWRIWEQALGPEHPVVADPINGLANLARDQGHHLEAERLYQLALSIRERRQGLHHPDTAETLHDLALLRQRQGDLVEARALGERAFRIRSQVLGESHLHTLATRELLAHLAQEQACGEVDAASRRRPEALADLHRNERQANGAASPPHDATTPISCEDDPLQTFLETRCELHSRAWCRSADLWQAYEQWVAEHQEGFPLSRRAFIMQLKAHGCSADRTKTARIWRGIALQNKNGDGR